MLRLVATIGPIPILLAATPASALMAKQKKETCKFGADHEKLTGAKRKRSISRCMGRTRAKRAPAKKPMARPVADQPAPPPKQ